MSVMQLKGSDGKVLEVDRELALKIPTIREMFEILQTEDDGNAIEVPRVNHATLSKLVEWLDHHKDDDDALPTFDSYDLSQKSDIDEWDRNFFEKDDEMFRSLLEASNFLGLEQFLHYGGKHVSNMIKGKSPEEIRRFLHLKNDFPSEEEEKVTEEKFFDCGSSEKEKEKES